MSQIENINKDYYNKLYRKKNLLVQLIYPFISYDQQCKSKYNIKAIKTVINSSQRKSNFNYLDYGFGHGSLILKVPQKDRLYGCDISHEAVNTFPRVARIIGKHVKTFLPEEIDQAVGDVKFDLISLSHVIEHVDDDADLLNSLAMKMHPDGKFLINVPINELWVDPKHVRKYSIAYMYELAKRCNLKIESWQEAEKWSGLFLEMEKVRKISKPGIFLIKTARFVFALMPLRLILFLEKLLPERYINRQLIVLLSKS